MATKKKINPLNFVDIARTLRQTRNSMKLMKALEDTLSTQLKDNLVVGIHTFEDTVVNISQTNTTGYDSVDVYSEFTHDQLRAMFGCGVFKVDTKKFETWAEDNSYDVSKLKKAVSSYIRVLVS